MATISAPDATGEHSPITPVEYYEDEPDEEWKAGQKEIIGNGFHEMIQEAKDRLERRIQSIQGDIAEEEQQRERGLFVDEYHDETAAIRALAKEEFEHALARERLRRRLRRDVPIRGPIHHSPMQSLRLDLEQEQAATLKAAALEGDALSDAFQSLLEPLSDDEHPSLPTPVSDAGPELSKEKEAEAEAEADAGPEEPEHIGPGALMIKITRLPTEPPPNGNKGWVKASDAARKHELAVRQRANSRTEVGRIAAAPAEPAKKWVSASDAARKSTQRRIAG
ncbi:hypothetical protein C8F04DRAFT_1060036 [Mycena alexandri]|uniref:Uncharacterized protein n=1 Tax=Mycena alexandri TaxID=1745969 RepID=A0AAD6TLF7_9AGAR|nr:hypothetical protein C8F04DRAFT_1060036 [Mycena alexandri]